MEPTTKRRILGCLFGIATGDAIGKQTENLSHEEVLRWYPNGVHGFEGRRGTPIPRYLENRRHVWLIGETTDDTERTIAVARAILRDGEVHHNGIGRELLRCSKSVHPGVRSLWEFHEAADATRVTEKHDGCGAAIRAAPVGVLYRSGHLRDIVTAAREASVSTHGGPLAIAAAAATAAAVSGAVDGMSPSEIIAFAERAAALAESERLGFTSVAFAAHLRVTYADLAGWGKLVPSVIAARYFPDNPLTIVPLALALATTTHSAEAAILLASNVGGDSDSVASIAGGVLGARCPDTVNSQWLEVVEQINGHDLESIAVALAALRH
jgi:ADP-ribosylglycohydrolase